MSARQVLHILFSCSIAMVVCACSSASSQTSSDAGYADAADGTVGNPVDASRPVPEPDAIPALAALDQLLEELRADRDGAMLAQSRAQGWPAPVDGGYLFVSTNGLSLVAGDHDNWSGSPMTAEDDFHWVVLSVENGSRYKFTDGANEWVADPWSRSYAWDDQGEMSTVSPTASHLDRFFQVGNADLQKRTIRVWVPEATATHILYAHDGQNLFNPDAPYGGWHMNDVAPAGLMIVGIDYTDLRTWEYTHTSEPGRNGPVGGGADKYVDFVHFAVRELIRSHYGGEPAKIGAIGSSFGGLASLQMANRYPGEYDFVGSLSGVLGWGSIVGAGTDTMIRRYVDAGHRDTALYIDSGGRGGTCVDSDGDGTNDDDPTSVDSYCENIQFRDALVALGYVQDTDLWHWWAPDALHNEAAWAARILRPMQDFMSL